MKLIVRILQANADIDTAFLMCAVLPDFMAYISYVISQQFRNDLTTVDVPITRVRVPREVSWSANLADNIIVPDLPILELITMQVYVQPRVVRASEYILDRIPEYDPKETDVYREIAPYPYVSDVYAARLDNNPMSPVPRDPEHTIVEDTGMKLRAVLLDGGSPGPDVSRTVHIDY